VTSVFLEIPRKAMVSGYLKADVSATRNRLSGVYEAATEIWRNPHLNTAMVMAFWRGISLKSII